MKPDALAPDPSADRRSHLRERPPEHSILLSARDEGAYLRRTVDDLLRHSDDFEIVIVDDASSDGSAGFLALHEYRDLPIFLVTNEERRGLIQSRARAADLARGRALVFIDAHSAVEPDWLSKLGRALASIEGKGIVVPRIHGLDPDGWKIRSDEPAITGASVSNPWLDFGWTDAREVGGRLLTCTIVGCVWMMTRQWYRHIGELDRGMVLWGGENIDLPLRTWIAGGWCIVEPEVAVGHLFKENTGNPTGGPSLIRNKIRLAHTVFSASTYERVLGKLAELDDFDEARRRVEEDGEGLAHLAERMAEVRIRSDRWLIETFDLPLFESKAYHEGPANPRTRRRGPPRPRVAVLVPFPQAAAWGAAAVDGILERTAYGNFEVLLASAGAEAGTSAGADGDPGGGRAGDPSGDPAGDPSGGTGEHAARILRTKRVEGHMRLRCVSLSDPATWSRLVNVGVAAAQAEFVVVLGAPVALADEHWLEELLLLAERHPRLLLAAPRLRPDAGEEASDAPPFEGPYQALACPEALVFLQKAAFEAVGGLDPRLEDPRSAVFDLALNGWLSGHEVWRHPGVEARLLGGVEAGAPEAPLFRIALALKYFGDPARREAAREALKAHRLTTVAQVTHLEACRREFLKRARFDEDWLFCKLGIEETESMEPTPNADCASAKRHAPKSEQAARAEGATSARRVPEVERTVRTELEVRATIPEDAAAFAGALTTVRRKGGRILAHLSYRLTEGRALLLVCESPEEAALALAEAGHETETETAVVVRMEDRPGALEHLIRTLHAARIGVAYCYSASDGGTLVAVFGTDESSRAEDVLRGYLQLEESGG